MRKPIPLFVALFLLLFGWSLTGAQEEVLFNEDFEGPLKSGWSLDPGWEITQVEGNAVLEGKGHTWATIERGFPGDFQLSFRARILNGRLHLVTHLTDHARYYIGLGTGKTTLNKQYFPDEFQENLVVSGAVLTDRTWHQVDLISSGDVLTLLVDGVEQWSFADPELLGPGGIAFETLEQAVVQIDEITVVDLRAQEPEGDAEGPEAEAEAAPILEAGFENWIRTGGPLGGLGYDVRMHPQNPDRMFVTDAFSGVFISEDGGQNWYPSNEGISDSTGDSQDAIPVFCLTIDPNHPDTVWAGTQFSGGMFKSSDGGKSWERKTQGIYLQDGLTFRGISIAPGNSQVVYIAGEISSWAWSGQPLNGREFDLTQGVVYKTTDGGENWREIWRGDNLARYILINPQNPEILYLSTGIFDREAANSNPKTRDPGGVGVLKSVDGGKTWEEANNGLNNLYVGSLFMHPENPEILLAGTGNVQYHQQGGIYLTTDGAQTWRSVFDAEGDNVTSVEFSESDPEIAYAGGIMLIMRSTDGGLTWEKVSQETEGWGAPGVRGGFPIDFQVDLRDSDRIFANNYGGGNFLSEDGGQTWEVASRGYTGSQVRSIAVDPDHPGRVYAAARSGLFVSHDGGSTWQGQAKHPYWDLEWTAVAVNPDHPDDLLTANNYHGSMLFSADGAQSLERVSPQPGGKQGIRVYKFAPSDPEWVYAGTAAYFSAGIFSPRMPAEGIYLSRDGGQTWHQITTDDFADAHVMDLDVAADDPRLVYAATSNYGLIHSPDGGKNWTQLNQGLRMRRGASAVAVHPENPQLIFAGIAFGGIYRSDNGGQSWQQTSIGLNPEANISDVIIDPHQPEILYASDLFSGVYRSTDGGDTWRLFSQGLRMRAVNQLALSSDSAHLYAATEGEGVYRLDLNGAPPPEAVFPEQVEKQEVEEPGQVSEGEEVKGQEIEPVEEEPAQQPAEDDSPAELGRQICPVSYLPLVVSLVGYGFWKSRRRRRGFEG